MEEDKTLRERDNKRMSSSLIVANVTLRALCLVGWLIRCMLASLYCMFQGRLVVLVGWAGSLSMLIAWFVCLILFRFLAD
jgi:hypothetical protein